MSSMFQSAEVQAESSLTEAERQQLHSYEKQIGEFLFEARKVNAALVAIREKRLYRQHYSTFESYVKVKWADIYGDWSRMRIWQVLEHERTVQAIEASDVNHGLQNDVPNERQTRPLNALPLEERPAAYALAQEQSGTDRPTGAQVAAVVADLKPTEERISRLDTGRGPKATPPTGEKSFLRKSFQVSEFKYDPASDKFQFMVFKPANPYKGWESKREYLSITRSDLMWEFNNLGFELTRKGTAEGDADGASACEVAEAPLEEIDAEDLAITQDLPADIDSGARALVAKERRRIAAMDSGDSPGGHVLRGSGRGVRETDCRQA